MSYHAVQLDTFYSYSSSGGPGHKTIFHEMASGQEVRFSMWEGARRRWDVAYNIKTMDQAYDLYKFYLAREGGLHSFRFWDPLDHTSAANGRDDPDDEDQYIGEGDGTDYVFQTIKTYTSGTTDVVRNITKIVADTEVIALNGTPTTAYSINDNTGLIIFDTPPGAGVDITMGYEFDVEARFDDGADEAFQMAFDAYDLANLVVPIKEVIDELAIDGNMFFGGYKDHGVITSNISITLAEGLLHVIECNTASLKLFLPNVSTVPYGHLFTLDNLQGAQALLVRYHDDTAVFTLGAAQSAEMYLAEYTGTATWVAI